MIKKDRVRRPRRKICQGCVDHIENVDYKDIACSAGSFRNEARFCPAA